MASIGFMVIIYLLIIGFYVYCGWKLYEKAGQPGWASIVPIYNLVVLLDIVKKPRWWILLCLVPLVNLVILIMVYLELAKAFGKSTGFGIGLLLLSFIFYPMLALDDSVYVYGDNHESLEDQIDQIGR